MKKLTDAIKSNFPGAEVKPVTEKDIKDVGPISPFTG